MKNTYILRSMARGGYSPCGNTNFHYFPIDLTRTPCAVFQRRNKVSHVALGVLTWPTKLRKTARFEHQSVVHAFFFFFFFFFFKEQELAFWKKIENFCFCHAITSVSFYLILKASRGFASRNSKTF